MTNPPFSKANQFIHQALIHASKKVAILGRLNLLETKGRKKLFTNFPFARLYVFSERIQFGQGSNAIAFAWFVWDYSHTGKPIVEWL